MFQSLNLFKSINCPYYSTSNSNNNNINSQICERPHCQFKHPISKPISTANSNSNDLNNSVATSSSNKKPQESADVDSESNILFEILFF